jgi:hypothetical protein
MGIDRIDKILAQDQEDVEEKQTDVITAARLLEIVVNTLAEVEQQRQAISNMVKLAEWQRMDYLTFKRRYDRDQKMIDKALSNQIYFIQKVMVKLDVRQDAEKKRGKQRKLINLLPEAFQDWVKETLPEDYERAINPPSWMDSVPRYKPPEEE